MFQRVAGILQWYGGRSRLLVNTFRCAGSEGEQQFFATEFALCAVGEAVQKDFVQPEFHHAGDAVPGKGELPDDNIGFKQCGLFGGNVEAVIGIEDIEAVDFCLRQGFLEGFDDGFNWRRIVVNRGGRR